MESEFYGNWLIRRKENFKLPGIKANANISQLQPNSSRRVHTKSLLRKSWPKSLSRSPSPKSSSPLLNNLKKELPFIISPVSPAKLEEDIKISPHRVNKVRQKTPVLVYENVVMSKDLAIMAQVRRKLINEVTGSKILNLTQDVVNTLKYQYLPDELKNNESSQQHLQKQKASLERTTRHPLGTAAYAIRSLSPTSRKVIKKHLKLSLPQGSRFLEYS